MGVYITADDISSKKGLSDADIEKIITSQEDWLHDYEKQIFYEGPTENVDYVFKFTGNGKAIIFLKDIIPYRLCSVTKIEAYDASGSLSTVDESYYEYDGFSLVRTGSNSIWTRSRTRGSTTVGNYRVTCTLGNAATDSNGNVNELYKPEGIITIVKFLVDRELDQIFDDASGTGTIGADAYDQMMYESEKILEYSYKRKKSMPADSTNKTPTEVPVIDNLLQQFQNKDMTFLPMDSNLNESYADISRFDDLTGE